MLLFEDGGNEALCKLIEEAMAGLEGRGEALFVCWAMLLLLGGSRASVEQMLRLVKAEGEHEIKAVVHRNRVLPLLMLRVRRGGGGEVGPLLDALLLLTCQSPFQQGFLQGLAREDHQVTLLGVLEEGDG